MCKGTRVAVIGTRAVNMSAARFRVVCATCDAPKSNWTRNRSSAIDSAANASSRACKACGAS